MTAYFTKARFTVLLIVGSCLAGFVFGIFTKDTNEHLERGSVLENSVVDTPETVKKVIVPLDTELLFPHTEEGLRLEINDRNTNDKYRITAIIYRARWNAAKDPIKYGKKWIEIKKRYINVIQERKFQAIMHLADYDQINGRHQILGK